MKIILFLLSFFCLSASALDRTTVRVVFTNTPVNGNSFTISGSTRTFKPTATNTSSQITIGASIGANATNTYNQAFSNPFGSANLTMYGTNGISVQGQPGISMSSSIIGTWGYVTNITQTGGSGLAVVVPLSGMSATDRLIAGDGLVAGINSYAATNVFSTATPALVNYLDTTSAQSMSNKTVIDGVFQSGDITDSDLGYVRIPYSTTTEHGIEFKSSGGSRVTTIAPDANGLPTLYGTALYPVPTNDFGAYTPSGGNLLTRNSGDTRYPTLTGANTFTGTNSMAQLTNTPIKGGTITGATLTTTATTGALDIGGDIAYQRNNITTLASGNNAGVNLGVYAFVEITTGPTAAFALNGVANGRNGKSYWIYNKSGYTMTVAHNSGVDPTPANRILTVTSADVVVENFSWAELIYDSSQSRWVMKNLPLTSATTVIVVDTISEALAVNAATYSTIIAKGYASAGDGGGGVLYTMLDDGSVTNYGTIFKSTWSSAYLVKRLLETPTTLSLPQFGGVGSGSVINNTALTNIMQVLSSAGGGTIRIPTGRWAIDPQTYFTSIEVPSGITIQGEGPQASTLCIISQPTTNHVALLMSDVQNVTIRDLRLEGYKLTAPGTNINFGIGFAIYGSTNILLDHVEATNFWFDGFTIANDTGASDTVTIINSQFRGNQRNNGSVTGARNFRIEGCLFENAVGSPAEVGLDVEANSGSSLYNGRVLNNVARNNGGPGFYIQKGLGTSASMIEVAYNSASGNGTYGIAVIGYDDANIHHNTTTTNASRGIYFQGGTGGKINSNVSIGNSDTGIDIVTSSGYVPKQVVVSENTSVGNVTGIELRGFGGIVTGNTVVSNLHNGITISGADSWNVSGNYIGGNGQTADATYYGVLIQTASTHNYLSDNIIRHSPIYRTNAVAGAASTTVTLDANASTLDDYYIGQTIQITSGVGSNEVKAITGYVGSTKVATVVNAWTNNPTAGNYEIRSVKRHAYGIKINSAIDVGNEISSNDLYASGVSGAVADSGTGTYAFTIPIKKYIDDADAVPIAPGAIPDPIVPPDGTQNITGALATSGAINSGGAIAATSAAISGAVQVTAGNVTVDNDQRFQVKDSGGTAIVLETITSANNVRSFGSTLGGDRQWFAPSASSSYIWFGGPGSTQWMTLNTIGNLSVAGIGVSKVVLTDGSGYFTGSTALGLTQGGTAADLSAAATGGILYKGASAIAVSAALTGILIGNGSSAPSAQTTITSAQMIDPEVPVDGTKNITGILAVSSTMTSGAHAITAGALTLDNNQFVVMKDSGGTGRNLGLDSSDNFTINGASGTDYRIKGATSWILKSTGKNGIGVSAPNSWLTVRGTTEQFRLEYDVSNYVPFTISSGGNITVAPTGGIWTLTGSQVISSGLTVGSGTGVAKLSIGVLSAGSIALASEVSGTLPIANGGTAGTTVQTALDALHNLSGLAAGDLFQYDGTHIVRLARGTAGYVLTAGVATNAWAASAGGVGGSGTIGTLPYFSGGTTLADSPITRDSATQITVDTIYAQQIKMTAGNTPYISTAAIVLNDGNALTLGTTITTPGTTGAQTINKMSGRVNIAAGGSSIVVTDSLVTTNSTVFAVIATDDTTATIKNVVAGTGSFTIKTTAACTAETAINFMVIVTQ